MIRWCGWALTNNYSGSKPPSYQWTTGLEIWDGFPCGAGMSCYNSTPTTTAPPSSTTNAPSGYALCATENGTCSLAGTMDVAYGANGSFLYKYGQTGSIACDSGTFGGDPADGVVKSCYSKASATQTVGAPAGYALCANENSTCALTGTMDVAYGANGSFLYKYDQTGSVGCDNVTFGGDPADGVVKSCYSKASTAAAQNEGAPSGYNAWCADENNTCTLVGTMDVAYGANGSFSYKYGQTGSIGCDNITFGGDPINGVVKSCYTKVSPDIVAPSAPTSLTATAASSSKINLTWKASTDNVSVAGYKVYRNNIEIGMSAAAGFTDSSVVGGTSYSYTIKAYDAAGNLSASSNTATVKTPVLTVSITSYSATNLTSNSASINWTTNVPSGGKISYGTSLSSLNSSVNASNIAISQSVKLTGLRSNTNYYYIISTNTNSKSVTSSFKTRR